ncbi:MAG: hypothetical protein ACYCQI_00360 [Gammaproteobacteria bacterium]
MKSRLPSFFPAVNDMKLVENLTSLHSLMKLSRPLLSIIAEYAKEENPNYNEELDRKLLASSEPAAFGYNDIKLFLSAVEQGCEKTAAHMLKRQHFAISAHQVIFHNFALETEHHQTTPLLHALRHRQFSIVSLLVNDFKDEIKKTINARFQTKQILSFTGSIGQPWVDFGTALSYAIEACHLPTIISLRDLGAEVAPAYCLDSLKRFLESPPYATMSDKVKRPFVITLMNHGNIKINDENLSTDHINRIQEILDPGFLKSKIVAKRR